MLIMGPDGTLVELEAFHAACVDLFRNLGAAGMFTRSIEGAPAGSTSIVVLFDNFYEVDAGRSPDEAFLRVIARIAGKGTCNDCRRPTVVDTAVTEPVTIIAKPYLAKSSRETNCTLYFDHRDASWKKACAGFDPTITPFAPELQEGI